MCRLVLVMVLSVAWASANAADPGARCARAKQHAAAQEVMAEVKCYRKAEAKRQAVDANCLVQAQTRFASAFDAAEGRAGCVTTDDAGAIGDKVRAFVADVVAELPATTTTTSPTTCGVRAGICGGDCPNDEVCSAIYQYGCACVCHPFLSTSVPCSSSTSSTTTTTSASTTTTLP